MLQVSMYLFAQIINSVKRDPCGLERWKRFLEGVELEALESKKGLNWQRRMCLAENGMSKSPKLRMVLRNKKTIKIIALSRMEIENRKDKVLLARQNQVTRGLNIQAEEFRFNLLLKQPLWVFSQKNCNESTAWEKINLVLLGRWDKTGFRETYRPASYTVVDIRVSQSWHY